MTAQPLLVQSRSNLTGITCVMAGVLLLGAQDLVIKMVSGVYPLHEIVLVRSLVAVVLTLGLVHVETGLGGLITRRPVMHLSRGGLLIAANMAYYVALSAMQLAEAGAIYFAAPLIITLLAIPLLGEKVGARRIAAVLVGLLGVVVMLRPGLDTFRAIALLPLFAAACYALTQTLARRLGTTDKAGVMAFYVHAAFLVFAVGFGVVAGDGRFEPESSGPAMGFLLRAWQWPDAGDLMLMVGCGVLVAGGGYLVAHGYRVAEAQAAAPFEYVGLPFAVLLGYAFFNELPDGYGFAGMVLIAASGLYIFYRERQVRR